MKELLKEIEEFKALRNAFAHGVDVQEDEKDLLKLRIQLVSRSGKEKNVEVSPESHEGLMADAEALLDRVSAARKALERLTGCYASTMRCYR